MKNKILKLLALASVTAAAFTFAPNIKITIEQPKAFACDPVSGSGCD